MANPIATAHGRVIVDERPLWKCEVCGDELNHDGVIVVSYADIQRYQDAAAAWEEAHAGEESTALPLVDHPRRVSWHVIHDRCGGEDQYAPPYTISVERIDTWSKVAGWTAHLHTKTWFPITRWDGLLYGAGATPS